MAGGLDILELSEESAGGNDFYDREQLKMVVPVGGLSGQRGPRPELQRNRFKDGARTGVTE